MDQFLGQVIAVGFSFAPVDWVPCDGRLLSIAQYNALFALLGTTYGGDGIQTFGVPNLQGRSPMGQGTGLGLPQAVLGQIGGTENVTLTSQQIPGHNHPLLASSASGTVSKPAATAALSQATASIAISIYGTTGATVTLAPAAIGSAGGNQPHENRQPFNTVNYIISTVGVFPTQS
ncbi:phage tail protein [Acidisphaera sp. S103]|uniref:phage tail protein n=1 Tax=Acidisphaera sp. S103 TaxID=1747223 RepID=UPI00131B246B|nr:tail fiber protein [Acidisphaera sp. S103]